MSSESALSTLIVCRVCGQAKAAEMFPPAKQLHPSKRSGKVQCLPCRKVYMREYHRRPERREYQRQYHANPEKRKRITALKREANRRAGPIRAKLYAIKHKYGLAAAEYARMVASQGGHCAICGGDPGPRGLRVDHCHATGKVRQLLCDPCNHGLGRFRDDPERMRRAANYIERHRAT